MNKADALRTLPERFPVIRQLSPEQQATLSDALQWREAPAGTVMFDDHQPCMGFPLLVEGRVRVVKSAPNGREIVLYRVEPGEGCILSGGCLLGHSDYSARGLAERDVTVLSLPPAEFSRLIAASPAFREFVFGMYGARLAEVMELVEEVAFRKLDTRLAQLLIHRGPVITETQQRLAHELGSVREVVSRVLRSFEERGWIQIERERVTVRDMMALTSLSRAA
ncbi:MAG: Crp/Fnr family transcriptional regulator [Betaproteobacteria bacterium]|nr:Crp/Fnr family transcriptional regulator [Betaproteobacteria bacterium]